MARKPKRTPRYQDERKTFNDICCEEKRKKPIIQPRTDNQKDYYNELLDDDRKIVFVSAPPGTGKTLLACKYAAESFHNRQFNKIIITRPIIECDERLGFLPGSKDEKVSEYVVPVYDALEEFFSKAEIEKLKNNGVIEFVPLAFMRGRTFKNTVIIADEMQSSTINQMKMMLTRLGEESKLIITGDENQTDRKENGMSDFLVRYDNSVCGSKYISVCDMDKSDIMRSQVVSDILSVYGE